MASKNPSRIVSPSSFIQVEALKPFGLTAEIVAGGITHAYRVLDGIDASLGKETPYLVQLIELANFSSVLGNVLRDGIAKASAGKFQRNKPHTYPDLVAAAEGCQDIEIKIALEDNKPKGHLAKPGPHLTFRYVLGGIDGSYTPDKRGDVAWIWEVRAGALAIEHFNLSNTAGDSGKTAVINAQGLTQLRVVYCDLTRCPYRKNGRLYQEYARLVAPPPSTLLAPPL